MVTHFLLYRNNNDDIFSHRYICMMITLLKFHIVIPDLVTMAHLRSGNTKQKTNNNKKEVACILLSVLVDCACGLLGSSFHNAVCFVTSFIIPAQILFLVMPCAILSVDLYACCKKRKFDKSS